MIKHLERVGLSFLEGYHGYLRSGDFSFIHQLKPELDYEYRGFAFEGSAMGIEIMDFFRFSGMKQMKHILKTEGNNHIYMMIVGAGWAYARLPVHPEKAMQKFDPVLKWLAIDGYGFHQAYFKTEKYVRQQHPPKELSEYGKRVFYQGVGRCLWFVECGEPSRIANTIQSFPEKYHQDFWAGVGLACAYAGGVDEEAMRKLKSLGSGFTLHLAQGAAFAAKARLRAGNPTKHTEKASQILAGCSAVRAAEITDESLPINSEKTNETKYEVWRQRIRTQLEHTSKHKTNQHAETEKIPN